MAPIAPLRLVVTPGLDILEKVANILSNSFASMAKEISVLREELEEKNAD